MYRSRADIRAYERLWMVERGMFVKPTWKGAPAVAFLRLSSFPPSTCPAAIRDRSRDVVRRPVFSSDDPDDIRPGCDEYKIMTVIANRLLTCHNG